MYDHNLHHSMRSNESKQKALAFSIFETIENSPNLQDLLVIATSDTKKAFFINNLLIALPDAFAGHSHPKSKSHSDLFNIMTAWFGTFNGSTQFIAMEAVIKQRQDHFIAHCHKKIDFTCTIGLNWSPATRDQFIAATRTFFLPKLETPYPIVSTEYVSPIRSKANGQTSVGEVWFGSV